MSVPVVSFGELCEMDRQGLRPDDPIASGLPFVGVEHVESDSGAFNFDNGSRTGSQRSTTFRFDERHVLYAKLRPYLNKVATPAFAGRCSTELVPLLPRDGVDREFIAFLLRRQETVDYVMSSVTGARMPRTDMKALMSLRVPLPPLDEQRRIVGILNRAAKIERLRARARELMGEFIPALFVRMFGDPVDNPNGYHRKPLSECAVFVSGATPSKQNRGYWDGDVPWITAKDMKIDLIADSEDHVSKLAFEETNLKLVPANTPIMVVRGMILSRTVPIALTARVVSINQDMKAIEFDNAIDPTFGLWCLRSLRQRILEEVDTAAHGTKRIDMSRLGALPILIPSRELQHRFVGISLAARTAASQAESGDQGILALIGSLMSRLLADSS